MPHRANKKTVGQPASRKPGQIALRFGAPAAAFALGVALALPGMIGAIDFCLDDAWIHLVYAGNAANGSGLSYNPGDAQTGFSSPAWVALLVLWPMTGNLGNPLVAVMTLGLVVHGLTTACVWTLVRDWTQTSARHAGGYNSSVAGYVAALAYAAHPTVMQSATSGMEVGLASLALCGCLLAHNRDAARWAFALGALAYTSRPETLFFLAAHGALRFVGHPRRNTLASLAGAVAGLAGWVVYCLLVSGHPWPNTKYVKSSGIELDGLVYLMNRVLPGEPWLVGLGGVIAIAFALRHGPTEHRARLWAILLAWSVSLLATATTRALPDGVLFHAERYFAIFAIVPAVLLGMAATAMPRRWYLAALTPVALVGGLQYAERWAIIKDQQRSVHLLHTKPALYVAERLPADATVAVEGAGALRWFTPPTMRIIDVLGLNNATIAHADDDAQRVCLLARMQPTHFVLPEHIAAALARVFEFEPMASFPDPAYAQVEPRHPLNVGVFATSGLNPRWRERCELAKTSHGSTDP